MTAKTAEPGPGKGPTVRIAESNLAMGTTARTVGIAAVVGSVDKKVG